MAQILLLDEWSTTVREGLALRGFVANSFATRYNDVMQSQYAFLNLHTPGQPMSIQKLFNNLGKDLERAQPKVAGVYFLTCAGVVSYIGQSADIYARIATHRTEKRFDDAFYIRVDAVEERLQLESLFIRHVRPVLNGTPRGVIYGRAPMNVIPLPVAYI